MKINVNDVEVGYRLLTFDEEKKVWYLTEVIRVQPESIMLRDIDQKSDYQGMIWESDFDEIVDVNLYKIIS